MQINPVGDFTGSVNLGRELKPVLDLETLVGKIHDYVKGRPCEVAFPYVRNSFLITSLQKLLSTYTTRENLETKIQSLETVHRFHLMAIDFVANEVLSKLELCPSTCDLEILRKKAALFVKESQEHPSLFSGETKRLDNAIQKVLANPRFQKNPQAFLIQWKEKRGETQEYRFPEDAVRAFFDEEGVRSCFCLDTTPLVAHARDWVEHHHWENEKESQLMSKHLRTVLESPYFQRDPEEFLHVYSLEADVREHVVAFLKLEVLPHYELLGDASSYLNLMDAYIKAHPTLS